jgi:hypothetical protein
MEKYNGWTNRETWLVNLYFGDTFWQIAHDTSGITPDFMAGEVSAWIEEKLSYDDVNGFIWDMLDLSRINWIELAMHYNVEE